MLFIIFKKSIFWSYQQFWVIEQIIDFKGISKGLNPF